MGAADTVVRAAHERQSVRDAGERGYYWSSSLDESYPGSAWLFSFYSDVLQDVCSIDRYGGQSVRAVRSQN